MNRLTFSDFKNHKHEFILVVGYTISILMVYVSMTYAFSKKIWLSILVAAIIILLGALFLYLWVYKCVKKEKQTLKRGEM